MDQLLPESMYQTVMFCFLTEHTSIIYVQVKMVARKKLYLTKRNLFGKDQNISFQTADLNA